MSQTVSDRSRDARSVESVLSLPPAGASVTQARAAGSAPPAQPGAGSKDGAAVSAEAQAPTGASAPVNFGAWKGDSSPKLALGQGELLRRGSRGDNVRRMQEMLQARGVEIEADGIMGRETERAVREFQRKHRLQDDGIVGKDTQGALNGTPPVAKPAPAAKPADSEGRFADTRRDLDRLPPNLRKHADAFQAAGERHGVDPRFLAAIAMQETGGGTSSAFRRKNNAMGVSGRGGPRRFSSVEASIDHMARGLARPDGYYAGRSTIREIGKVYAPRGAANDPNDLNRHWVPNVSRLYEELGGDASQRVILR